MFSNRIISSGRFLSMPPSAQALYFHLGINADDDGVVESYQILKMTDSKPGDLEALVKKEFVLILNNELVVVILDWREHNLIRPDRKIDSIYKQLLEEKVPNYRLVEPKPRADTGVIPRQVTTGQPLDDQWTAQVRLGKDRIVNTPISNEMDTPSSEESESIQRIPVDSEGLPIEDKPKKAKAEKLGDMKENSPQFKLAYLWQEMASEASGLPKDKIPMSKFLFVLKAAIKREDLSPDEVKSIFKYFFQDKKIKDESKISIQLCLSETYISQWRIFKKKKDDNMTPWNLYDEDE